jgi:hypothetical protein
MNLRKWRKLVTGVGALRCRAHASNECCTCWFEDETFDSSVGFATTISLVCALHCPRIDTKHDFSTTPVDEDRI